MRLRDSRLYPSVRPAKTRVTIAPFCPKNHGHEILARETRTGGLLKKGDLVLFYHSVTEKQVVGIARVQKEAYPDPTATEGDWSSVDLAPAKQLNQAVNLETIRSDKVLANMPLVKQTRLSVVPLTQTHFARILKLANTTFHE